MKLLSVNVGLPREIEWKGKIVRTSIFKEPVSGRVRVTKLNVSGDQQSDLAVHGGINKAVYVYPSEHYAFWREELPGADLPWGMFGENLTTEGPLDDQTVFIGDRFQIRSAEFVVTQPHSGRNGFYLAVLQEGEVAAGESIELVARDQNGITVAEIVNLYSADAANQDLLRRVSELSALPESWRDYFRKRLWNPDD